MTERVESRLYVAWHTPEGRTHPVGLLSRHSQPNSGESYQFVYLKNAEHLDGFEMLPGLPELYRTYQSEELFPLFRHRLMSRRRPDYGDYIQELALDAGTDPFKEMARNEGRKVTDPFEVFAPPIRDDDGCLTTLFFSRGIDHDDPAGEAVARLQRGDPLQLIATPENTVNPRALRIAARSDQPIGWVPDYLVDTIHELQQLESVALSVEHTNPDPNKTDPRLRLLCRLTAPWPTGYQPLCGPEFQPITG